MKKLFLLFTFYFLLSTNLFAQETFFKFLQGWKSRTVIEYNTSYIIASTDATIPYQNHSDFSEISLLGDSITNWQFEIDTAISTDIIYTNSFSSKINNYRYTVGYMTGDAPSNWGFLSKFSADFKNVIWTKILPVGNSPNIKVISVKNDTSLILGSFNRNNNNLYTTFLETDTSGIIRWQKDFDCTGDCHLSPFHILPTVDNGFIFTCYEDHVNGQPGVEDIQMAIIKTDSLGNTEWRHSWGGDTTKNRGSWVVPLDDGNFLYAWTDCYMSGYPGDHNTEGTIRFAKFDINGNVIWYKHMLDYISHGHSYELSQMELMPDGNIIVGGYKGTAGILLKVNQEAEYLWHRELFPPGLTMEENNNVYQFMKILGITCTSDDGFILAGEYFSAPGGVFTDVYQSAYAYKLDDHGCYEPNCDVGIEETFVEEDKSFILKPNPACDFVLVEGLKLKVKGIEIYDLTGKMVKQVNIQNMKNKISIADLSKGIYLVKVGKKTKKLIIE